MFKQVIHTKYPHILYYYEESVGVYSAPQNTGCRNDPYDGPTAIHGICIHCARKAGLVW